MQYRNSSPNTATIIEFCYLCARIIPTNWTFSSHSYVEYRLVCVSAMYTRNSILVANNLPIFQFTIPIFDRVDCVVFFALGSRAHVVTITTAPLSKIMFLANNLICISFSWPQRSFFFVSVVVGFCLSCHCVYHWLSIPPSRAIILLFFHP